MAGPCASPFCSPPSPATAATTIAAPFFSFNDLSALEAFFLSLTFTMFLGVMCFAAYVVIYGVEVRHSYTHHFSLNLEAGLIYSQPWLYGPPPAYDEEAWGDVTLPVYVGCQASPPAYEMVCLDDINKVVETDALLGSIGNSSSREQHEYNQNLGETFVLLLLLGLGESLLASLVNTVGFHFDIK
ncbi:hypothetical protein LTR86_006620 [Recurvomyces mirabilis]|nr:hypothetical protein LTR86_006620 [Recurvomyces mirabilis]